MLCQETDIFCHSVSSVNALTVVQNKYCNCESPAAYLDVPERQRHFFVIYLTPLPLFFLFAVFLKYSLLLTTGSSSYYFVCPHLTFQPKSAEFLLTFSTELFNSHSHSQTPCLHQLSVSFYISLLLFVPRQ